MGSTKRILGNIVTAVTNNIETVKEAIGTSSTSADGLMSKADKAKIDGVASNANKTTIVNNLTTSTTGSALDASQGKALNDKIASVSETAEKALKMGVLEMEGAAEDFIVNYLSLIEKTGKKYTTRLYYFSTNTSSSGEKLNDNAGLVCEPSTDTVEGEDDYADIPIFQWWRCNYIRDDEDGFARPIALKGWSSYREEGAYDVGTLHPTFYWGVEDHETYYDITISDTEYDGLVPWAEAVKADGTVMPYWIESSYMSVTASDGLLRSQPNKSAAHHQSYNNQITNYQKKGAGYWGSSIARNTYAILMFAIKYGTKNSQSIMTGCSQYNSQIKCAVAEENVKRVLLTSQYHFVVGGCVSVGVADGTNTHRGLASMSSVVDRTLIKSIETVTIDSTNYIALNLVTDASFNTTTDAYVSTMPQWTGTTDTVIGHHDGSPTSNTDEKHTFRIQGQEYMNGQSIICADTVMEYQSDYSKNVYVAPRGVIHVQNAHTGYDLVGNIPDTDYWSGDVHLDTEHASYNPSTIGSGDKVGTGDFMGGNKSTSGLSEWYSCFHLAYGSAAGSCGLGCWFGLDSNDWETGSCD